MRIGFNFADIKTGGQYHGWLQDLLLRDSFHNEGQRPRAITKKEIVQGKYVISVSDADIPSYAVIVANKANVVFDGFDVYVELPASMADTTVPAWLSQLREETFDEDGNSTGFKTLGEMKSRESLDQTKFLIKIEDIKESQLDQLDGVAQVISKSNINEIRVILDADYNEAEV